MSETAKEFLKRLEAEEAYFFEQGSLDQVGVGLLTAIKKFDYYYYNLIRHAADDEASHNFQIMRLGLPRLIASVLGSVPSFRYPVVTFRSDKTMILGALDQAAAFGFIEEGRRLAQGALAGECDVVQVSDRQFDVVLPNTVFHWEQHEASVENHYVRQARQQMDAAAKQTFEKMGALTHIDSLLKQCVYVFNEHFIGYDAHPDLDDYFFGLASAELQNQSGYDTWSALTEFGGITMQKYILAVTFFLAIALRHERFAAALIEKSPTIRLRDILTVTAEKQELEAAFIEALNMYGPTFAGYTPLTPNEAKIILKVLSVRRDNLAVLSTTMAPVPFLIEFSGSAWIKSTAGIQMGGMTFLLESLRFNFPADYDRNQQARQGSMQRALKGMLGEILPSLRFVENVKIRKDGRTITDIDFATIDEQDGSVMLFQLKHQDHYGADMKRRFNRAMRLRNEVNHWLESVREWLAQTDERQFASTLQMRGSFRGRQIFLVVVARHFAHFLSSADLRSDAAYATWIQFYDAWNRLRAENQPFSLAGLFEVLQRFMTHKVAQGSETDLVDSYHLRNLSYRILPASAKEPSTPDELT